MPNIYGPGWHMHVGGDYKPGDMPPESGYLDWHEWAEVQYRAGIRQVMCPSCTLWRTPQELSDQVHVSRPFDSSGVVHLKQSFICKKCVAKASQPTVPS